MPDTAANRRSVRDLVRIGQVWEHRGPGFAIEIKQIHRADRLVEAWVELPGGVESRGVSFADLGREYELVG